MVEGWLVLSPIATGKSFFYTIKHEFHADWEIYASNFCLICDPHLRDIASSAACQYEMAKMPEATKARSDLVIGVSCFDIYATDAMFGWH